MYLHLCRYIRVNSMVMMPKIQTSTLHKNFTTTQGTNMPNADTAKAISQLKYKKFSKHVDKLEASNAARYYTHEFSVVVVDTTVVVTERAEPHQNETHSSDKNKTERRAGKKSNAVFNGATFAAAERRKFLTLLFFCLKKLIFTEENAQILTHKRWQKRIEIGLKSVCKGAAQAILCQENSSEELKKLADTYTFPPQEGSSAAAVLEHCYLELLNTLGATDYDAVTTDLEYGNAIALYAKIMARYNPNIMSFRFSQIKQFVNLEMDSDEKFSDFVGKIDHQANTLNAMKGNEVNIGDPLKAVVLIEGTRVNHEDTFGVVTQIIENQTNMSYSKMVETMTPVAVRAEMREERAKTATTKPFSKDPPPKNVCYNWLNFGFCRRHTRDECRFDHTGPPGNKKCDHCKGPHFSKSCSKKGETKEEAKAAKEEAKAAKQQAQEDARDAKLYRKLKEKEQAKLAKRRQNSYESDSDSDYDKVEQARKAKSFEDSTVEPVSTVASAGVDIDGLLPMEKQKSPFWGLSRNPDGWSKSSETQPETPPSDDWLFWPFLCSLFASFCLGVARYCDKVGLKIDRLKTALGAFVAVALVAVTCYFVFDPSVANAHAVPTTLHNFHQDVHYAGRGLDTKVTEFCGKVSLPGRPSFQQYWTVDSGCTSHMCNNLDSFLPNTMRHKRTKIEVANGQYMVSLARGSVRINVKGRTIILHDVLYVPASSSNLMSISKLMRYHHRVIFDDGICTVLNKKTKQEFKVPMTNDLFDLPATAVCKIADTHGDLSKVDLWHQRLAHASIKYLQKANLPGANISNSEEICHCDSCMIGGIRKRGYTKRNHGRRPSRHTTKITTYKQPKTTQRLEKVMADTCTPYPRVRSVQGNKHFFIIMDIHTRKVWIRFGKSTADFPVLYQEWLLQVQNEVGMSPILFMPDGGTEFTNSKLAKILKESGTKFMTTCPGNPNQNSYVERVNGVIQEKVRKVLAHAGLPDKYWEDAARFVVEVQNAMPHKALDFKTPNSMWSAAEDKTISRTRIFGCAVWYLANNSQSLRKGTPKYRKGIYLGTSTTACGYRILDLASRKIVNNRDTYFNETEFPYQQPSDTRRSSVVEEENDTAVIIIDETRDPAVGDRFGDPPFSDFPSAPSDDFSVEPLENISAAPSDVSSVDSLPAVRRSGRDRVQVNYAEPNLRTKLRNLNGETTNVGYTGLGATSAMSDRQSPPAEEVELDPGQEDQEREIRELAASAVASADLGVDYKSMTRNQIRKLPVWRFFKEAERRELDSLGLHGTYKTVRIPRNGRTPITCRWCYDVKRDGDNNIVLYKARLVAHGFKQQEGIDFKETFAAVAQMKSFRATVALSRLLGLRVTQIDISSAFLHGVLEEELYMTHPPGYPGDSGTCLKLEKGIYGLKQAGRIWNTRFVNALKNIGFTQLRSDTQVMVLRKKGSVFIIGIFVDDATFATNDEQLRDEVVAALRKEFLVKDLGDLSHYLGIKVVTTDKATYLSQPAYIEKVLAKFSLQDANDSPTPGVQSQQLSKADCPKDDEQKSEMAKKPYRSLIGSLLYAYLGTRPDIGSALIKVASFCENPGQKHWTAAKRILRYLKGTTDTVITYASGKLQKGEKVQIVVYCDSDWAQDSDDRRSISGYVVKLSGGPVSWQSKKQPTVALSTCEAEFVSLTEATKEVLWYTYFLDELGVPYDTPVVFTDSKAAMDWSKNACHHQRSKHVALKYFFVRDTVRDKLVKIQYVKTADNQADMLTKNVSSNIFAKLKPRLMGVLQNINNMFAGKTV